ncbi:MAG: hypothetical protein ACK5V3_10525 [Bdellovibrionales bacterium]
MRAAQLFFFLLIVSSLCHSSPDWTEGALITPEGRPNPYQVSIDQLESTQNRGYQHALQYPISITGILIPERPVKRMMGNRLFNNLFDWLGLHSYENLWSPIKISTPVNIDPNLHPMGYSRIERDGATGFTVSCAGCHSSPLFGKVVIGLTNRFPRANHFFIRGQTAVKFYNQELGALISKSSPAEAKMLSASIRNLQSVGLKMPIQLGLDTSLAQVALSLNKREPSPWAEQSTYYQKNPRPDHLEKTPADSKPAVWWNLKYKNRWLSDGSVVSGNPILTNILWNEIGRGVDLKKLDLWLNENPKIIEELTTAVFSTEAPRIEDFFSENQIIPSQAKNGEKIFNQTCAKCHGEYIKNWSLPEYVNKPWREQIKTHQVIYHDTTPIKNVGTDPLRYLGMKSLEQLNRLEISKNYGIKIEAQVGYVPPPLVGIWARYPYMHNNSMPNLCAVLTPSEERPKIYFSGPAENTKTDYDFECGGYPVGDKTPALWTRKREHLFDTRRPGLSNQGHDNKIFIKNGQNILTRQDRLDLIQFLLTL